MGVLNICGDAVYPHPTAHDMLYIRHSYGFVLYIGGIAPLSFGPAFLMQETVGADDSSYALNGERYGKVVAR